MAAVSEGKKRLLPGLLGGALLVASCGDAAQTIETEAGAPVLRVEGNESDNFEAPTTTVRTYAETTRGPGATRTAPTQPPSTLAAVDDSTDTSDTSDTTTEDGSGGAAGGGDGGNPASENTTTTASPATTAAPYAGQAALSLPHVGANGLTLQSVRVACTDPAVVEIVVTSPSGVASAAQTVALTATQGEHSATGTVVDGTASVVGSLSPAMSNGTFDYVDVCASSRWTVFVRIADDAGNTFQGVVQASVS